jgi:hypothetical protein
LDSSKHSNLRLQFEPTRRVFGLTGTEEPSDFAENWLRQRRTEIQLQILTARAMGKEDEAERLETEKENIDYLLGEDASNPDEKK